MDSLTSLAATYVGENASLFPESALNELPSSVLEKVLPYLSAYVLHRLSETKQGFITGFSLNNLWKLHVKKRWNRSVTTPTFFKTDEDQIQDYHRVYLIKHFFNLLNICGPNVFSPDPSLLFQCPLQKLKPWEVSSAAPESLSHMNQLIEFAQYADNLSLLASQCAFICSQPRLLECLQGVTQSIDLYVIIDRHYGAMRTLLWKLINEGNLKHVKLSNISSSFSKENLLDLLKICAGIKVEAKLPQEKVFPEKQGVKRRRSSESSPENRPYKIFTTFMTDIHSPPVKRVRIKLDDPDDSQCVSVETSNEEDVTVCNVIDFTAQMEKDESIENQDLQSDIDYVKSPDHLGEPAWNRKAHCTNTCNSQYKSHTPEDIHHEKVMLDSCSNCSEGTLSSFSSNHGNSSICVDQNEDAPELNCIRKTASVNAMEIYRNSEGLSETDTNVFVSKDSDEKVNCSVIDYKVKSNKFCNEVDGQNKYEAVPSCSSAIYSVHQSSKSDNKADETSEMSASHGLYNNESDVSSCSRLPVLAENDEMAPFLLSESDEDDTSDQILLSEDFETMDEVYKYRDLYEEALQPVGDERIPQNPVKTWRGQHGQRSELKEKFASFLSVDLPELDINKNPQDVESLVISCQEGLKGMEVPLQECLGQVLPHWTNLRKLAVIDADSLDNITDIILGKVAGQKLNHLVLSDCNVDHHILQNLLHTMYNNFNIDNEIKGPPKCFEIHQFGRELQLDIEVDYKKPQYGIGKLDISWTALSPFAFIGVCKLIQYDNALTSLKLNGCFLKEYQIINLLQALKKKGQIETIGLGGNPMSSSPVEGELLLFLQNVNSLKNLHLNYTNLRPSFVSSPEFSQAVQRHPGLRELSLRNNHLEAHACRFLADIGSSDTISLTSLDIGYNLIKVDDLLRAAETINSYRNSNGVGSKPVLDSLVLSGNRVDHKGQNQLRQAFIRTVEDLEVDSTTIDITNPHAEHVAQM